MRADFHPEALEEAIEASRHYRRISPALAERFQAELEKGVRRIEEEPLRWPKGAFGTRFLTLGRFPYLLLYRHRPTQLLIVAIAHALRRPGYWKARLRSPNRTVPPVGIVPAGRANQRPGGVPGA